MLSPAPYPLKSTPRPEDAPPQPGNEEASQNAGAAAPDRPVHGADAPPLLSNAELVQLQIRVIALENLVVALLAHAPEQQLELVRDIAASIFPRPGVEHRLTSQATAQMEHLAQRSRRLQGCLPPAPQASLENDLQQNS